MLLLPIYTYYGCGDLTASPPFRWIHSSLFWKMWLSPRREHDAKTGLPTTTTFTPFIFAECLGQNVYFLQKLHSRLHETHFFHNFRYLLVWPKCTPSIWCDTLGTFATFCIHSHVLVTFSYGMAILRDTLCKNERLLFFDSRLDESTGLLRNCARSP